MLQEQVSLVGILIAFSPPSINLRERETDRYIGHAAFLFLHPETQDVINSTLIS